MNKNKYPRLHPLNYILIIFVMLAIAFILVTWYMNNNSAPTFANNQEISQQSNSISSIEVIASNAISSSTLIVTVIGVFITAVTIFAAILVFTSSTRLEKVEEKAKEFENQIGEARNAADTMNYMLHIESGKHFQKLGIYDYAKKHYQIVLEQSKSMECLQYANYQRGLLSMDLFSFNKNKATLHEAITFYKNAIDYGKNVEPIIWASASADLGCSLGLEFEYFNPKDCELLVESIKYLKNAICTEDIPIYHKNIAITYALKNRIEDAIKEFEYFLEMDSDSKEITNGDIRKKNSKTQIEKLFSEKEKKILSKTYEAIIERLS